LQKVNILKKENERLSKILENEISSFVMFIFLGRENFGKTAPFIFPDPRGGGIKEETFTITERLYDFTVSEMQETLHNSELKIKIEREKLSELFQDLEEVGYIKEVYSHTQGRRFMLTEKGYHYIVLESYSLNHPGKHAEEESIYPQF
jgi:hypothetical protein